MAYLGPRWGVELIEMALRRGASVELLLPARANVYAAANLLAAARLLERGWPGLSLSLLHGEMVHAKALLASADEPAQPVQDAPDSSQPDGSVQVAFLGSANLVRGSMNLPVWLRLLPYDELNLLVREPAFCDALGASMDGLFARGRRVPSSARLLSDAEWAGLRTEARFSERRARWEELWQ